MSDSGAGMTDTFNLDLPGCVIGELVVNGVCPADLRPLLNVELFGTQEKRRIQAEAVLAAHDTFGTTDPIAVREILSRQGKPLDVILDITHLAELVPSAAHLTAHVQLLREQNGAGVFKPLSLGAEEFLRDEIKTPEMAIDNIWPLKNSGIIGGPEKAGKSWVAADFVLSLTTGTPFLGKYHVTRQYRILWWEEEDSRVRVHRRSHQMIAGRQRPMPASEHLRYLVGHGLKLDTNEGLEHLRAEIGQFKPDFVVVGNLREIHTKDENRPEMAHVRDAFRTLSREFGCAFVVIHHFRKTAEGQSRRGSQMLAGSGVWGAWVEAWIYVTTGETEDVAVLEIGSKDVTGAGKIIVQRRDVTDGEPLAEDEDGGKVWPVILTEVEPSAKSEESRVKVLEAVQNIHKATGAVVTVKEILEQTGLSRRTIVSRLPELEAAGLVQGAKLHNRLNGYLPGE